MLWPDFIAQRVFVVETFENLASIGHFLFSLLLALMPGCWRRYTLGYALYQLLTTLGKDVFFPGQHSLADWSWDFVGDMEEWLAAYGLAYALGMTGRLPTTRLTAGLCSWMGAALFYGALGLVWILLLVHAL